MASSLRRRDFVKLAAAVAVAPALERLGPLVTFGEEKTRPNVLFISVDDLRPELGCYGSSTVKSPNIDRLARQSLVFTRAYCPEAICNPARACMLTGMRLSTLRVWDQFTHFRQTHPQAVTLPQLFKNNGYEAIRVGKIYHNTLPDPTSWSRPGPSLPGTYEYQSPETRARLQARQAAAKRLGYGENWIHTYVRGPATEAFDAPDNFYEDGTIADAAIASLVDLAKKQPFFLAVGFIRPHLPFIAPKRYWDLYNREEIPLAKNPFLPKGAPSFAINNLVEIRCYEDLIRMPDPLVGQISEAQARLLKHGYLACVSFIDAQIGRIVDALVHLELRGKTIVVLSGDSGYKLGEHGSWGKQTNYEIDTRCPLIISAPRFMSKPGATLALTEFVDVYPTLCELAGLTPPENLEGVSLVPLFEDPARSWKTAAFSQFPRGFAARFMGRAMRTDRYRYIEWRDWLDDQLIAVELYDHQVDPMENENIASNPDQQVLVQQLSAQLKAGWQAALPKRES
jgi:iduronate 2-sulfatase